MIYDLQVNLFCIEETLPSGLRILGCLQSSIDSSLIRGPATSKSKAAMLVRWFRHHLWVGYLSQIISSLKTRHSILSSIEDKYKNNHHFANPPIVWQFGIITGGWYSHATATTTTTTIKTFFFPSFFPCMLAYLLTYLLLYHYHHLLFEPIRHQSLRQIGAFIGSQGPAESMAIYPWERNISHRKRGKTEKSSTQKCQKKDSPTKPNFWEVMWRRKEFHPESFPICNSLINYEWSFFNLFYPCLPIFVSSLAILYDKVIYTPRNLT